MCVVLQLFHIWFIDMISAMNERFDRNFNIYGIYRK